MSTDVASIMLPVSRGLIDRDRELDTMAGVHPNPGGAPAAVRGMKRGDPEPDGQTAAALVDSAGAECKRPRIDGSGGMGEVGQVQRGIFCPNTVTQTRLNTSVVQGKGSLNNLSYAGVSISRFTNVSVLVTCVSRVIAAVSLQL